MVSRYSKEFGGEKLIIPPRPPRDPATARPFPTTRPERVKTQKMLDFEENQKAKRANKTKGE